LIYLTSFCENKILGYSRERVVRCFIIRKRESFWERRSSGTETEEITFGELIKFEKNLVTNLSILIILD